MPTNSGSPSNSPAPKAEVSEQERPPFTDDDPSSDEHVERELQNRLADQKKLDARFTPKQLEHLNEKKDLYRHAPGKQRREIAQATGDEFLKQVQKAGRDPSKKEVAALYNNVKLWYAQRARSRHGPMHWTINWTGRQVFYKENTSLIQETQKKLFEIATGRKPTGVLDEAPDLDLVEDEEVIAAADPGKQPELFHFFQRALTAEWNSLSSKEKDEYDAKALLWRERGPSHEERTRLAEKEAASVLHQFADSVYRQMGVRLHFLVTYEDTSGDHIAFSLDFNNQIDGGISFKQAERAYLEKIDLENHWAGFVRRNLPMKKEEEDGPPQGLPRKRGDPLPIKLNEYREPIIPDISSLPKTLKAHRYFPNLVRSIMRHDYACARDLPLNSVNSAPPWREMVKDWRKFISEEYWPSSWPIGDPGTLGVDSCREILKYWFERQKKGEIPFQFHSYWTGSDTWEPRAPRTKADDSEEEEGPAPKKRKKSTTKAKKGKKGSAEAAKSKKAKSVPTSTARQSASAAIPKRSTSKGKGAASPAPMSAEPVTPEPEPHRDGMPETISAMRKGKGRAVRSRVDSSPEPDYLNQAGENSGDESSYNQTRDTPATRKLIGATARLNLNTPSRSTPESDGNAKKTRIQDSGSPLARIDEEVAMEGPDEMRSNRAEVEDKEREMRERVRREALRAAKHRVEVKRGQKQGPQPGITNGETQEEGVQAGDMVYESVSEPKDADDTNPEMPLSEPALDVGVGTVEEVDGAGKGQGGRGRGKQAPGQGQAKGRAHQGGSVKKVPNSHLDERGGDQSVEGETGEVVNTGAATGNGACPGSRAGPSTPRKQPQEDRLLLAAAANYLPTSAKRDRKKNSLFVQDEATPRQRRR